MGSPETATIRSIARGYAFADDRRAWVELTVTLFVFFGSLGVGLANLGQWVVTGLTVVTAAAAGLRIYMIQHDCLHGSFFSSRRVNDWIGSLISPVAMTPYRATQYIHNLHHTHVSDLDRRDTFEIQVMTKREYLDAGPWQRVFYRMYRSPVTLVLLGPFIFFTLVRRVPLYGFRVGLWDMILHNLLLAAMIFAFWVLGGWPGVLLWLPTGSFRPR